MTHPVFKIADDEFSAELARRCGVHPDDWDKKAQRDLLKIGGGMFWSEEFHNRALGLVDDIEKDMTLNLSYMDPDEGR